MSTLLKQSTAVDIGLGPFVDQSDGFTPETSLTISQADVRLKKNGGAWAQKADTNAATHEENGWYEVALNTTDTNTLGELIVAVNESGALPVWRVFQVVPANVYDSLVAGSDALQVHTNEITAGLITAAAIATGAIDADAIATDAVTEIQSGLATAAALADVQTDTNDIQTRLPAALVGGRMDSSVGAMASDTLTSTALATSAVTEIQSGLSTLDGAAVRSAVGLASANLDTQLSTIAGYIDTEVAATLAAVDTEVAAIKAKTDNLPAAPAAVSDIPTANQNADALLDRTAGVETNRTVRQALRLLLAGMVGKLSGAATTTVTIRDTNDSKDRIVATVDADGNRTAVTLDQS